MGKTLFSAYPRRVQQAGELLGYDVAELCLHNKHGWLDQTLYTQPVIYIVNYLNYIRMKEEGDESPSWLIGHSLGEINALMAAGAFDFLTGLRIVQKRAYLMSQAKNGGMAAIVGLEKEEVEELLSVADFANLSLANINAPLQMVVSGLSDEIAGLRARLQHHPRLKLFLPLKTSGAFHSRFMAPFQTLFEDFLRQIPIQPLHTPVIANVTARPYDTADIPAMLGRQLTQPVRWVESIEYLLQMKCDGFREPDDSRVLSDLVDKIRQRYASKPRDEKPPLYIGRLMKSQRDNRQIALTWVEGERRIACRGEEICQQAALIGSALRSTLKAGTPVLLMLPQSRDYLLLLLACWYAGLTVVPLPITEAEQLMTKREQLSSVMATLPEAPLLTNQHMAQALPANLTAASVITIESLRASALPVSPAVEVAPESIALLLFTSGSTSKPKGVMLSHGNLLMSATSPLWGLTRESRVVSWLPQYHALGLYFGLLAPLLQQAPGVIFSPEMFIRQPESWFKLIAEHRATHTAAPMFALDFCCRHVIASQSGGSRLDSLQTLICGGDLIHQPACRRFFQHYAALGLREEALAPHYGLSEGAPVTQHDSQEGAAFLWVNEEALAAGRVVISDSSPARRAVACVGRPAPGTMIAIVDASQRRLEEGRVGEIWLCSPVIAAGYYQQPDVSRDTFGLALDNQPPHRWLRSGDRGFLWRERLYVLGRLQDVIVIHGKNYHAADLEAIVAAMPDHPGLPCAVLADEQGENRSLILVQEAPGATAGEYASLAARLCQRCNEMKQVKIDRVYFVAPGALPFTASKKLRRHDCYRQLMSGALAYAYLHVPEWPSGEPTSPTQRADTVQSRLRACFARELSLTDANWRTDAPFSALGLDSIQLLRISHHIEACFGVPCGPGTFWRLKTPRRMEEYLGQQALSASTSLSWQDGGVLKHLDEWLSRADRDDLAPLAAVLKGAGYES